MKSPRLYNLSKVVYIVLLEISLIVDMVFALSVYEVLGRYLESLVTLVIAAFMAASILGTVLYLLHIWQMEYLTGKR